MPPVEDAADGSKARVPSSAVPVEAMPPSLPSQRRPELAVWPGSSLNWSSPKEEVLLYVELPFYLMMAEDVFHVKYKEASLKVEVVHGCIELQPNATNHRNHATTIFIARQNEIEPQYVQDAIHSSINGVSARVHRTTLIITTCLHQDVLAALNETPFRQEQAYTYLTALMVGHLPIINGLLSAYRRAAHDPFVQDVTEATVPIGFVRCRDRFVRVSTGPYYDLEDRGIVRSKDSRLRSITFATSDECREKLATEETPGESDLLDGWAYFFAGRFGDSIRNLVSAVEVLLEALITQTLREGGKSDEEIRKFLGTTTTNFQARLDHYLALSKRTLPGPILSWFPEVNGIYLRTELSSTRRTRHRIVHEGHRLDPQMYGTMLRAVETTTWLYSWLEANDVNRFLRNRLHQLKANLRGRLLFNVAYTKCGIEVVQYRELKGLSEAEVSELLIDNVHWRSFNASLFGPKADLALFVKMALACIIENNMDILEVLNKCDRSSCVLDHSETALAPGATSERFRSVPNGIRMPIFLLDLDGIPAPIDLQSVLLRMLQIRTEFAGLSIAANVHEPRVNCVVVVNHQRHFEPFSRQVFHVLDEPLERLLTAYGLTLVFTTDIWRYINGARAHGWPLKCVYDGLFQPGFLPCLPPDTEVVGEIIKFLPKIGVYIVSLYPRKAIRQNAVLIIRTKSGYDARTVESLENERQPVEEARGTEPGDSPVEVGVKFGPAEPRLRDGSAVFMASS